MDPDGKYSIPSFFIPDPSKMSKADARDWVETYAVSLSGLPLVQTLYSQSLNGNTSDYVAGNDSYIAQLMRNDTEAYVNTAIPQKIAAGRTQSPDKIPGSTKWNNLELQLSIGSSSFEWEMTSYNEETGIANVSVSIQDTFDFNKSNRSFIAETLTAIGKKAELSEFEIKVTYEIEFHVILPKIED